jgi:GT2 family glycosyltransferase
LNNDVRLSTGFFSGLSRAVAAHPDGLIAPCYDDHTATQTAYFRGPVEEFRAEPVEERVSIIDGTCFSMTAELFDRLGVMDARHFGRRGWGGIEDYVLRARALGGAAYVTRRAYLTHARGSTARAVMPSYHRYAVAEMRRGMRRIYGPRWREQFSLPDQTPDSTGTRMRDLLRAIEDRLGLSETAIGRR